MKLAIMQPYFFPYIGYWQLIHAVDKFVIYDDVNYIKGGWINRNRILINGNPSYMTLPLSKSSSNKRICDIYMQHASPWRDKILKMIKNTYNRAPYFNDVYPLVEKVILYDSDNLADYLSHQLIKISQFLCIDINFIHTSRVYENSYLFGQSRIIDICKCENADTYINLIGGRKLYNFASFNNEKIKLYFIQLNNFFYKQRTNGFIPDLSIIDGMMEIGPVAINKLLDQFTLVQ